jgi:hypothetical protein
VTRCPLGVDVVEKVGFSFMTAPECRGVENGGLDVGSRPVIFDVSRKGPERERDGWTEGSKRQGLEVLYDGGEVKFVTRAGKPSQPHAFETVVGLEMSKAHLNALAFIPRFEEALCPH